MPMCGSQSWLQVAFQAARRAGKPACTVESLAPPVHPVCDAAGSQRIKGGAGELHFGEVFIPFYGPKAHADRQDCLPHVCTSISTTYGLRGMWGRIASG